MDKKNYICFAFNKKYMQYVFGCIRVILRFAKEPNSIRFVFLINKSINKEDIRLITNEVLAGGSYDPIK